MKKQPTVNSDMEYIVSLFIFFWFCVSGFGSTSENEMLWRKLKSEIL